MDTSKQMNRHPPHLAAGHVTAPSTCQAGQAILALRWWGGRLLLSHLLIVPIAARVTVPTAAAAAAAISNSGGGSSIVKQQWVRGRGGGRRVCES
jgi:hypothetical protein